MARTQHEPALVARAPRQHDAAARRRPAWECEERCAVQHIASATFKNDSQESLILYDDTAQRGQQCLRARCASSGICVQCMRAGATPRVSAATVDRSRRRDRGYIAHGSAPSPTRSIDEPAGWSRSRWKDLVTRDAIVSAASAPAAACRSPPPHNAPSRRRRARRRSRSKMKGRRCRVIASRPSERTPRSQIGRAHV